MVEGVALSADGRRALSCDNGGRVRLWEAASGKCLRLWRGHTDKVLSVVFALDGRFALSGGTDTTVRLWRVPKADREASK